MEKIKNELTLVRFIDAKREAVWKVWTDPAHLAKWWGPKGFTNPLCKVDIRPGGSIHIDMQAPDGVIYPMKGNYLEIIKPGLLVFTSSAMDKNDSPLFKVFTVITLAEQDNKTKLIMHASASEIKPEAAPHLAGMEEGWRQSLDRLEDYVANQTILISTISKISTMWQSLMPRFQGIFRIAASLMFMMAGTVKLFAFPAGIPPNGGTVPFLSQLWIGAVLETFGGALLLLGLFTRPIAFILAGEMAVAYFQFHFPGGVWPVLNGGVAAVLYCFVWLYFSSAGPGSWSLDAKRRK